MAQAATTIRESVSVGQIRLGAAWSEIEDETEQFTQVVATLGRECREWAPGAANAEIETLISEISDADDAVIFTDGSVKRGVKSGWAYSVRVDGQTVAEDSGAVEITASSMSMEIKAVTEALLYLKNSQYQNAVIVSDSMSTLQKVKKKLMYADWIPAIKDSQLQSLKWLFCPGHSGVQGNERADTLAGTAAVDNNITLDPPTVMAHVREHLCSNREPSSSYTLQRLHEKGVKAGEGRSCSLHGVARRHHNQLLMETVSLSTLRSTLRSRGEQTSSCPTCNDPDGDYK